MTHLAAAPVRPTVAYPARFAYASETFLWKIAETNYNGFGAEATAALEWREFGELEQQHRTAQAQASERRRAAHVATEYLRSPA